VPAVALFLLFSIAVWNRFSDERLDRLP